MTNLTLQEKEKIKSILNYGLNLNPNLNFAYFLNAIKQTNDTVSGLDSKLNTIIYNQKIIDQKLDRIINSIK